MPRRRVAGFTLVEVLVALVVMAVLAGLAWRALDGILRSRDAGAQSIDRTMRLATVLAQWEQDLQRVMRDAPVPPLAFDGRALRLARETDAGAQIVSWSVEGGLWRRWASPVATRVGELQNAWMLSQQLQDANVKQLTLLEGVEDWQVYFFRGNSWSNAQSSGDLVAAPEGAASAVGSAAAAREQLPGGVRLVLRVGGQTLTRDLVLAPAS